MSAKQVSASSRSAPDTSPVGGHPLWVRALAVGFPLLAGVYLVLYLATGLPDLRGEVTRAELLYVRAFLPEQAAAIWFGSPPSFAIADRWPVLTFAGAILAASWLTGYVLLNALGFARRAGHHDAFPAASGGLMPLERFVFSCAIGLNAVSLYALAVGLAGALYRWCFLLPGALLALLGIWQIWRRRIGADECQCTSEPGSPVAMRSDDGISSRWLWLAAPFVAVIVLGGMLPPIDFDVREYHLQAPKEFFQDGRIDFLPHNVYGNMPLGGEMFSLLAMVLLDDWWLGALAGKTVIACFGPLTALALFAAGRRFASSGVGVVAAIVYLSIPWVSVVSTSGLIEGVLAFYLLMSLYAVLLWRQAPAGGERAGWHPQDAWLALSGWCAGAAVSCKYPAVLFVALPVLLYVAFSSRARPWRPLAIFMIALVAACGLWFIKNWALTGNPVYPLLYDWLGGATRTAESNERWLRAHSPHEFSLAALVASLAAVMLKSSWLSPLVIPLAALGLFVRRYRSLALALAGYFAYIVSTWWLFTHRIDRFWIPALPLLALLAGLGAVWSLSLAWRRTMLTMILLGLAINFIYVTSPEVTYNAYFVSLATAQHDNQRVNAWILALNNYVPDDSCVLSVGDAQVFDLAVPVLYNTAFDPNWADAIFAGRDSTQIAAELRRRRVSHVYINWNEVYRYRQPGNYGGMPAFVTPDWFSRLQAEGVFEVPWRSLLLPGKEVYPVRHLTAAVNDE